MRLREIFRGSFAIIGYLVGLIGLFICIMVIQGTTVIETRWIVLSISALVILFVLIALVYRNMLHVIQGGISRQIDNCECEGHKVNIYIDYSRAFAIDNLVSINSINDGHHKLIGIGKVAYYHENEYNVIEVIHIFTEYTALWDRIKSNAKQTLEKTEVTPGFNHSNICFIRGE